jgi:nucleoid DNA-binding protein
MSESELKGIKDAAKAAGIQRIKCPSCGNRFDALPLYRRLFEGVIALLKDGHRVNVPQFGIFSRKLLKGRTHNTPVTPSGKVTYNDRFVLRFRQAAGASRSLNEREPDPELSARGSKARSVAAENRKRDVEKLKERRKDKR